MMGRTKQYIIGAVLAAAMASSVIYRFLNSASSNNPQQTEQVEHVPYFPDLEMFLPNGALDLSSIPDLRKTREYPLDAKATLSTNLDEKMSLTFYDCAGDDRPDFAIMRNKAGVSKGIALEKSSPIYSNLKSLIDSMEHIPVKGTSVIFPEMN